LDPIDRESPYLQTPEVTEDTIYKKPPAEVMIKRYIQLHT
jgi:hypothetical protein